MCFILRLSDWHEKRPTAVSCVLMCCSEAFIWISPAVLHVIDLKTLSNCIIMLWAFAWPLTSGLHLHLHRDRCVLSGNRITRWSGSSVFVSRCVPLNSCNVFSRCRQENWDFMDPSNMPVTLMYCPLSFLCVYDWRKLSCVRTDPESNHSNINTEDISATGIWLDEVLLNSVLIN